MCRLFGMLSAEPHRPLDFLIRDPCSLLRQSKAAPKKLQADGWGIAYLDGGMRVVKSTNAVFDEPERFEKVVSEIDSTFVLAHLRRASNPLKLPKAQLMAMENVQPFFSGEIVFAHNGTVNRPNGVDLGDCREMVEGDNDSEVLFWLLTKCLAEEGNVRDAVISAELALENSVKKGTQPFTAINMIFRHGESLHAYCRYQTQPGKSLCMGGQGYYTMSYLPSRDKIIVMSEPSNVAAGWQTLGNGELLSANVCQGEIILKIEKLASSYQ